MKVLLIGVGGVGEAIAAIAKPRAWMEQMVLADYNVKRAEEVQKKDPTEWREMVNLEDVYKMASIEETTVLRTALMARQRNVRILHHGSIRKRLEWQQYRRIKGEKEIHGDILIYADTVALVTMRRKVVMAIIENKDIADTMSQMFDLAWANAKE